MKRIVPVILAFWFYAGLAEAEEFTVPADFGLGETLTFSVDYGFINAGEAVISLSDTLWVQGHPCYHLTSLTSTNSFFTRIFPVSDEVISYLDCENYFSRGFEKNLNEGKYHEQRWFIIDQENGWVFQPPDLPSTKFKADTIEVERGVQDALSVLYYVRGLPLEVGDRYHIPVVDNHKYYPMEIVVHQRDRVKVPAGRFDCLLVEPFQKTTGVFKSSGRLRVWITDDERHLPVLMKSRIFIGSISARLIKHEPGSVSGCLTEP